MIKIVIVDDHKIFLDGIAALLSDEANMEVLFVESNAKEALKRLQIEKPDLVISDISMPEMNGLEFIKILKNDFPKIKILVLSMFHNMQSIKDIDGFLLKETDKDVLINAINGIVLRDEKHFAETEKPEDSLAFKKSILSDREKEIIRLIAKEYTTDEMAEELFVSRHTIEAHRKNIFYKLNVKNIAGLVKMGFYLGILE